LRSLILRPGAEMITKATPGPSHSKGFAAVLNVLLLCFLAVVAAAPSISFEPP